MDRHEAAAGGDLAGVARRGLEKIPTKTLPVGAGGGLG